MSYDRPDYVGASRMTGWVGWIVFAATIMIIQGGMSINSGLTGIFRDDTYFTGAVGDGQVLVANYATWGWIHLIFGILLLLVGLSLFRGATWARVIAIFLVAINLVAQFTWVGIYPWWSLIMIALDILVLYAVTIHGGELREP